MTPTDGATESESPALSTLGERIKAVRGAWRWSQEEMAETLRVDQASISFWERGKIRPSGSALVAMAALFRTSIDALEKGDGFIVPAAPRRGSGLRAFRALPRGIGLPVIEPGTVAVVDLGSGGISELQPGEAAVGLGQHQRDGRRIWIVVE